MFMWSQLKARGFGGNGYLRKLNMVLELAGCEFESQEKRLSAEKKPRTSLIVHRPGSPKGEGEY